MSKKLSKIYPKRKNNRFYLDDQFEPESFLFGTIPSFVKSFISRRKISSSHIAAWINVKKPLSCCIEPTITWIGHATFLIQIAGINILTDPVFGNLWLLKRQMPVGIAIQSLPSIDLVLISHNHHDHMDSTSLQALKTHHNPRFLVPQGDKHWFDKRGFESVSEHTWWDQALFSARDAKINCSFLPSAHWSRRGLFDKNKSLWGSWMIEWNGYLIYFAGDTAYSNHFSCIAQEFSGIKVALMPIGPGEPRKWMKDSHIDAHEAGQAFLDLHAQHFIPMHWGTFGFGIDSFTSPIDQLQSWWQSQVDVLLSKRLHLVKAGEPVSFEISQQIQSQEELLK